MTKKNYTFDTVIEKKVLENYLSRSATAAFMTNTKTLEDDLRAIKNLGIKFIGRAAAIWEPEPDDGEHFRKAAYLAKRIHEVDEEIIIQACIFEAIYKEAENFKVPDYVLEDFGLPVEDRTFRFKEMLFPERPEGYIWGETGGIPDINRLETRLWFYYRATQYITAGYEALHMGQIHLYAANDRGFAETEKLFTKIRKYAKIHGRRHKVLMDAHSHGINIKGKLLLDYHAMPYTRVPLLEQDGEKMTLVNEGFSEGGENPNGWTCDTMPYLMEYDNWGGKTVEDLTQYTREERAYMDWWGYDQIGWFANQDRETRNHFLEYTYKWTQVMNVNAYFEIPFRRTIEKAAVLMERADNNEKEWQDYYQINEKSSDCPMGFGQEETIKQIWKTGNELREKAGNPPDLIHYGAKQIYDEETGVRLPEKVVVYGSFQPSAGAVKNDSNSEITRMYYIGDNTYTLTVVIPFAGEYDYAISTYGTLSATYCFDNYPRSGMTNKGTFQTKKDNAVIRFRYKFMDSIVTVKIIE